MRCFPLVLCLIAFLSSSAVPQTATSDDYSGMYSFLRDGEFIQVSIEDKGIVTGFVSRYGDSEADKDTFLDQFFKTGKLESGKLTFTTETVHGIWFTFEGTFERGAGKTPGDDAYYVIRGILTRFSTDAEKKTTSQARQVGFKSFPRDSSPN
jgi:hypothetical protein